MEKTFEVGKTYINISKHAGKNIIIPSGRVVYCPKEITILKDDGRLIGLYIHSYSVIGDDNVKFTIDDDDFKHFKLKETV